MTLITSLRGGTTKQSQVEHYVILELSKSITEIATSLDTPRNDEYYVFANKK